MFEKKCCKDCKIKLVKKLKVSETERCIRCWQNQAYNTGLKTGIRNSRIILITESRDANNKKIWTTEI